MNAHAFEFAGAALAALPSGALWWSDQRTLTVSDLHLGKSERMARRSGALLPPYDTTDTLTRLEDDITRTQPRRVICLGDSFDDLMAARDIADTVRTWLTRLQAGRQWVWIEGNHDPGPIDLGGTHRAELPLEGLIFRHIAEPQGTGEVSGHYHPKASVTLRGRMVSRACFLCDARRIILPAYGTYTGGLRATDPVLQDLMDPGAHALLLGQRVTTIPMPR